MPVADATLDTPIGKTAFCAVDVETSGLSMSSRVVEIGAVRFDMEGGLQEFQSLVNPCEEIWPGATAIHGIDNDMVKHAPRAGDVLPGLANFMRGCVFLAHNAKFDVRMIANELARVRLEPPDNPVLCTIVLARSRIPGPANYRLGTLVDHLGIHIDRLHNALPDAHAARHVFLEAVRGLDPETRVSALPGVLGHFAAVAPPSVQDLDPEGLLEELPLLAEHRLDIEMEYLPCIEGGPVTVTPLSLFENKEHIYLRAYCHRDGLTKTYRADRILSFHRI